MSAFGLYGFYGEKDRLLIGLVEVSSEVKSFNWLTVEVLSKRMTYGSLRSINKNGNYKPINNVFFHRISAKVSELLIFLFYLFLDIYFSKLFHRLSRIPPSLKTAALLCFNMPRVEPILKCGD